MGSTRWMALHVVFTQRQHAYHPLSEYFSVDAKEDVVYELLKHSLRIAYAQSDME